MGHSLEHAGRAHAHKRRALRYTGRSLEHTGRVLGRMDDGEVALLALRAGYWPDAMGTDEVPSKAASTVAEVVDNVRRSVKMHRKGK